VETNDNRQGFDHSGRAENWFIPRASRVPIRLADDVVSWNKMSSAESKSRASRRDEADHASCTGA
jgi:hypothetical protein